MTNIKPSKKDITICMTAGCLLGILCFVLVYGVKILDFTYDAWILNGGVDIKQHYIGFCHLRNNTWTLPLGMLKTLSEPFDMSIIYTDSIPLFALFFRLFNSVLPQHFQYFGLFGISCFALMGGLSSVLIRRFTDKYFIVIGGSLFFILSFPVLQRMYYHTALAAQWIIVLAMIIWVYTDITKVKTWVYWGLIGVLSVSIHSYYVFFTGVILLAQAAEYYVNHNKTSNLKNDTDAKDKIRPVIAILVFSICSLLSLYVFGAFSGAGRVTKGGFGDFNGNLNGFINPEEYSSIFKPLKYNGTFEYEGFGYLGAGIFLLVISALIFLTASVVKDKAKNKLRTDNTTIKILFLLVFISLILSTVPRFSFNDIQLLNIPLPAFIKTALGICRTNGRFIWIGTYSVILLSLYFVGRFYDRTWIKVLFAAAVILQLYDMSGKVMKIHDTYNSDYSYKTAFSELETLKAFDGKTKFVYMYDGGDLRMDTAFTAYIKNMSQNTFYYARPIDDEINEYTESLKYEFAEGRINDDAIYIFRDEDYTDEYRTSVLANNAVEYIFDGHVAIATH